MTHPGFLGASSHQLLEVPWGAHKCGPLLPEVTGQWLASAAAGMENWGLVTCFARTLGQ